MDDWLVDFSLLLIPLSPSDMLLGGGGIRDAINGDGVEY